MGMFFCTCAEIADCTPLFIVPVCHARAAQVGVVNRTRREGEEMMLEATIVLLLGLTDIASL
jgi:hypothetical protein